MRLGVRVRVRVRVRARVGSGLGLGLGLQVAQRGDREVAHVALLRVGKQHLVRVG